MVFFPPPLLFNSPLPERLLVWNFGCPLSAKLIIMISATLFHSPFGLLTWVPYHFFSQPSPRYDQHPNGNLLAYVATYTEFATQCSSFPEVLYIMSLYMDMKMIRPWNYSSSHFNSAMNFWTSMRIPSVLRQLDPILWDSVFPNTILSWLSRLELVLDWCLPNKTPSQKRHRFWTSQFEQLHHRAEMILSIKAGLS